MDTFNDQASMMLAFLTGDGTTMPPPNDRELALLLFNIGENLMSAGVLADVIGNRPPEAHENYRLMWAMKESPVTNDSPLHSVRAREILTTIHHYDVSSSVPTGQDYLYLACTRTAVLWLLVTDRNGVYSVSQLSVDTMADFFSHRAHWATHISLEILGILSKIMKETTASWREKAQRVERSMTSVELAAERVTSAFYTPRTSGNGIEG